MNTMRRCNHGITKMHVFKSLLATILLCALTHQAVAQRGRGPRMDPEKLEAAWTLQANSVARSVGLSEEATGKLVAAYTSSRKSHQEALEKAFSDTERGRGMFEKMREIRDAERKGLQDAIAAFLTKEQVDKAIVPLGTFDRQWDRLVDSLTGFGLDEKEQDKGVALIAAYVVDFNAAREKAMPERDFEAMRTAMQELKEKLDTSMADVLSEDQLAKWKESTAFRSRGRSRDAGDRPRGEGRGRGQGSRGRNQDQSSN